MVSQETKDKLIRMIDTKDPEMLLQALEINLALEALTQKEMGDLIIPLLINGRVPRLSMWNPRKGGIGWSVLEYLPNHPLWGNVESFIFNAWSAGDKMTHIPPEIGNLTNLKRLVFRGHNIKTLPPSMSKLKKLEKLIIDGNQLNGIPSWIGGLTDLVELTVDDNNLSSLPKEIGNLNKLQELSISGNNIKTLPKEMGRLTNLSSIFVGKGSPITPKDFPPPLNKMNWKGVVDGLYVIKS